MKNNKTAGSASKSSGAATATSSKQSVSGIAASAAAEEVQKQKPPTPQRNVIPEDLAMIVRRTTFAFEGHRGFEYLRAIEVEELYKEHQKCLALLRQVKTRL